MFCVCAGFVVLREREVLTDERDVSYAYSSQASEALRQVVEGALRQGPQKDRRHDVAQIVTDAAKKVSPGLHNTRMA